MVFPYLQVAQGLQRVGLAQPGGDGLEERQGRLVARPRRAVVGFPYLQVAQGLQRVGLAARVAGAANGVQCLLQQLPPRRRRLVELQVAVVQRIYQVAGRLRRDGEAVGQRVADVVEVGGDLPVAAGRGFRAVAFRVAILGRVPGEVAVAGGCVLALSPQQSQGVGPQQGVLPPAAGLGPLQQRRPGQEARPVGGRVEVVLAP